MTNIYKSDGSLYSSLELFKLRGPVVSSSNIDGTTEYGYQVSSITDVGAGIMGVNFTGANITGEFSALATTWNSTVVHQDTTNLSSTRSDFWSCDLSGVVGDPGALSIPTFGGILILGAT